MAKRWTGKDLKLLQAAGRIRGAGDTPAPVKKTRIPKQSPAQLRRMLEVLNRLGIDYVTEHRFHQVRKFRFDIAILEHRIAVEYEGIVSARSRHTTVTGYTRDAEKYNLATAAGWKVLRYTALNYQQFETDIKTLI